MASRRILITNNGLALRAGTELFVRDLALTLANRGHTVAVYSNRLGDVGNELRGLGLTVVSALADLPWKPELIHGHHHLETMTALVRYPDVPALYVSHGWIPWEEIAPVHPRVLRYAAVDRPTQRAVARRVGLETEQVILLPNPVDLTRFVPRPPLPVRPARALLFCNYSSWDVEVAAVREGCRREGVLLKPIGLGVGRPARHPERLLRDYDLVFAKGRAALEAAAVGAAVILCGSFGLGPMVTSRNVRTLRTLECDLASLIRPLDAAGVASEIRHYDPADAAEVSRWVRATSGLGDLVTSLEETYEELSAEFAARAPDPAADRAAASDYLRWLSDQQKAGRTPAGAGMVLRNLSLSLIGRFAAWRRRRIRT